MEKQIAIAGYWVGLVSLLLAVVLRLLAMLGVGIWSASAGSVPVSYLTFFHGAEVFLLLSIASSAVAWLRLPRA